MKIIYSGIFQSKFGETSTSHMHIYMSGSLTLITRIMQLKTFQPFTTDRYVLYSKSEKVGN